MSDEFPTRRSMREAAQAQGSASDEPVPPSDVPVDSVDAVDAVDAVDFVTTEQVPTGAPEPDLFGLGLTATPVEEAETAPRRRGRRRGWIIALVIVALIGGGTAAAWGPVSSLVHKWQGPEDFTGAGTGSVAFQVADGATGEDIARNLVSAGVTKSFEAFYELCVATNPTFEPGVFQLKKQMSARAALDALLDPANRLQNTVLVTEGQTQADVFAELEQTLGFSAEELATLAATPSTFGLPAEATSLEGFLFPATYQFDEGVSAEQALSIMVNRSFQALDDAGVTAADRWRTIVLASLVQKEAGLRDDYYKVSRVFLNRLNPDLWPLGLLQSDATVAYGTGNTHRVSTTDAERADASNPFNTYVHPGLVAAPISNPGELAIDAALHPADGPWLYFVTVNLDTGETVFSTTEAEHNAAVEQWLAWMAEHPEYQ